jgi:polyferredoxin
MDKIGKEHGLIAYATLSDYNANMALATGGGKAAVDPTLVRGPDGKFADAIAHFHLRKIFRLRTFIYLGAWCLLGLLLSYALLTRHRLEINVLHDRNPQFVTLSDGSIRNGFTLKLLNMIPEPRNFVLSIEDLPGATMSIVGIDQPLERTAVITVEPDKLKALKVFVKVPRELVSGAATNFNFFVQDQSGPDRDHYVATFNAPETSQ